MVTSETLPSDMGMSVTREHGLYLCNQDGCNSPVSPVVLGDIVLNINIQSFEESS